MAYQGNSPAANFQSLPAVQRFNGDGSDTTFTLASVIANDQSILVSVDGVTQDSNAYSVSGTTLTFTAAPSSGTGNIFVHTISPVGSTVVPPDGSVTQAKVAGEAINESKLQVSNNPTNGLFLSAQSGNTGGLTWAEASAGKILQVVTNAKGDAFSTTATNGSAPYGAAITGFDVAITPSSTSSKVMILLSAFMSNSTDNYYSFFYLYRNTSTEIFRNIVVGENTNSQGGYNIVNIYIDSPSSTSAQTYTPRLSAEGNTARIGAGAGGGTVNMPDSVITLMEIAG